MDYSEAHRQDRRADAVKKLMIFLILIVLACPAPAQEPTVSIGSDTMLTSDTAVLPITVSGLSDTTYAVELELQVDTAIVDFLGIVISDSAGILETVSTIDSASVNIEGQGSLHQVYIFDDKMRIAIADSVPLQDGVLCSFTLFGRSPGYAQIAVTHTVQNSMIDAMTAEWGTIRVLDRTLADLNADGVQDRQDAFQLAWYVITTPSWGIQDGWPSWRFRLADRNQDGFLHMIDASLLLRGF